jgi:molybdopterin synthase catalytic subunit
MVENILISGPLTHEIISSELVNFEGRTDSGGHSVFLGRVRADISGVKRVKAIEYSAYTAMVNSEADKIINMIHAEFSDVTSVRILHSVGIVMAGEISLFVMVSAGHRHQTMEACRRTVEYIKSNLPVWKKEIFDDNSYEWKPDNLA